jgi:transcriptional regulator with XRE-family HTH domain
VWIAPKEYKIVGARLEAVRKAAGVTQVELAKRLKKPQSFVSACESGRRRVDILELVSIVTTLSGDPREVCSSILDEIAPRARPQSARRRGLR